MTHPACSPEEIVRRGQALYEERIRREVEADHRGEFLVLDIDTGDYEVDADEVAAVHRAIAKHPKGRRFILRIGYPAAHRLGGRWSVSRP